MLAAVPMARARLSPLTAEWVGGTSPFQKLEPEWNELLQNSDSDCLFLTREWLSTWWKHLAEDRRLAILAHSALVSRLATQRVVHKWSQLRRGAGAAAPIAASLKQRGWSLDEAKINVCPYIPLAGKTWETYLGALGAEHRYNFNRKWKRLNRDFSVSFGQVVDSDECHTAIGQMIAQHNTRWQERGGSDAFHLAGLRAFHREFSQIALGLGWLRLYSLRLDEKPVAFLYGFLYRQKFYFYQSSFDEAYSKHSPGLIAMGLAIRSAIEEGAQEYDLLHGDEPYKSHWSCDRRELGRLELYPPDALGRFWHTAVGLARRAKNRRPAA